MIDIDLARYNNGTMGTVHIRIPVKVLVLHVSDDQCIFSVCGWPKQEQKKIPTFIFGQSILQSLYLIFDAKNKQIGFASPVHSGSTVIY